MPESQKLSRLPSPYESGSPPRIALGALAHDPEGRLLHPFGRALPVLLSVFDRVGVVITPGTTQEWTRTVFNSYRVSIVRSKYDEVGENRREALALALSPEVEAIQYTDLDRIIHWALTQPSELTAIAAFSAQKKFTVIGRSDAAFATHPMSQRVPEIMTNGMISTLLGRDADVTSGCCAMSRETCRQILELSKARGVTTDGEWPILAALILGYHVESITAEGLAFETADYYAVEIRQAGGLASWLQRRYDTAAAWQARLAAAEATVEVATQVAMRSSKVVGL